MKKHAFIAVAALLLAGCEDDNHTTINNPPPIVETNRWDSWITITNEGGEVYVDARDPLTTETNPDGSTNTTPGNTDRTKRIDIHNSSNGTTRVYAIERK